MNEPNPAPIVLTVHRRGVPEFERFVISDQYLRYWTGDEWSSKENDAQVFCDNNEALERVQKLLLLDLRPMCKRRRETVALGGRWRAVELCSAQMFSC
jgi:hypothetical protein